MLDENVFSWYSFVYLNFLNYIHENLEFSILFFCYKKSFYSCNTRVDSYCLNLWRKFCSQYISQNMKKVITNKPIIKNIEMIFKFLAIQSCS